MCIDAPAPPNCPPAVGKVPWLPGRCIGTTFASPWQHFPCGRLFLLTSAHEPFFRPQISLSIVENTCTFLDGAYFQGRQQQSASSVLSVYNPNTECADCDTCLFSGLIRVYYRTRVVSIGILWMNHANPSKLSGPITTCATM